MRIGLVGMMAALGAMATVAGAQAPTSATLAGTRDQIQRAAPPPGAAPPARLTVDDETRRAPCPFANGPQPRFRLAGVTFGHLRGLPPDALRPAYAEFAGKEVTPATVCAIRDAATGLLRRAGYIAALQVPEQRIEDGVVRLDIVMARIVRIELADGGARSRRLLQAYFDKLLREPVFNEREAERYLLLARDLPGYDIRLTLRSADGAPGDVVGVVTATRTPLIVSANLQNYGSHSVGRWGALLGIQANDLLGHGDRLTLGAYNTLQTHEQSVLQAGYDMRLGAEGLAVGGRFTYAWTRPDLGEVGHPLASRTLVASLEAAYPLRRSSGLDLRAVAGVDLIDQTLDLTGSPLTRDRLRILYGRLDFGVTQATDDARPAPPRWRAGGSIEARHGTGLLGATGGCGGAPDYAGCTTLPTPSRLAGDPTATMLRFSGEADYRVGRKLAIAVSPRLQYAFDPLLAYEQYSGGAYTIGRGYDPGVIVGDSGAGASFELRWGDLVPRSARDLVLQPYAFLDGAWTWTRATDPAYDRDRILSAGAGLRGSWGDRARFDLGVAVPLHRSLTQVADGHARILMSVTTRIVPWRTH